MQLDKLPTEFVPDIELFNLQKVNKLFQQLASDHVLWLYIFFKRHSATINKVIDTRRSRRELVQANIIKGSSTTIMLQKIERGDYIGDVTTANAYNLSILLRNSRNRRVLNELIHYRPEYTELLDRNLIPTKNPSIAPNLLPKVNELQKKIKRDKVKRLLEGRRSFEDLRNQGIIDIPKSTARSLVPLQKQLSQGLIRKDLFKKIQCRMNVVTLEHKKLLPDSFTAPMICPSIRSKIRFYEHRV